MHLISELSDHLDSLEQKVSEDRMIGKKELSILEGILFLRAVEQCEGKRKASEALCASIDTINKYLENLEQELGVKLISSNGRGSSLTSAAQRIVEKTTKIKEIIDEVQNISLENREIKGEVKVYMALGYASYLVPQDLSALFDVFPGLKINSVTATSKSFFNVDNFDIALTYETIEDNDIVLITEKHVHCGFFASPKYLAEKGYPLDIDDMVANHRLIAKHDNLLRKVIGDERFKKAKICFESNNSMALINALENNTGIGIMPLSFSMNGFVCLDNIACDVPVTYHLYANRHTKDIPKVRTLINFHKDIMDKMVNPIPSSSLSEEPLPMIKSLVKGQIK